MKSKFLFTLFTLAILNYSISFSKDKIKITESVEKMSKGYNNALVAEIPYAKGEDVERGWKKLMKDYAEKVSGSKGEVFADNALFKEMSENTIDVYAKAEESKEGTKLLVFFDLGGAYLSSSQHDKAYKEAEKMIYQFAVKCAREAVGNELEDTEKQLKRLEREQERLISDKEGLQRDIERYKANIQKAEEELKTNGQNQEAKKLEIESQHKAVEEVKEKLTKID